MKRTKTIMLTLLCSMLYALPAVAADVAKIVQLTTAGTLSTTLTDEEKNTITHLTITGEIDKRDFDVMKRGMENLTYIDLSGSCVVAYSYYPANEIPEVALGCRPNYYNANKKISSFIFPRNITTIGSYAFSDCSGFTGSLSIPQGVTKIGHYAFSNCSGFTGSLAIPQGVTKIGQDAFSNCSGFTGQLAIPQGVTEIEDRAFVGCKGFSGRLSIPQGVTKIGSEAFFMCSGFTEELTIPQGVTEIDSKAFFVCSGIDRIKVENPTPCTLASNAFPSNKIIFVPSGSLAAYKEDKEWSNYTLLEKDIEVTIHLESPNTLISELLAEGYPTTTVTKLTLSGEVGDDDWALLKSNFTSLYYLDMSSTTATAIPNDAFAKNTLLQTYIFPNNTTTIGSSAFWGCSGFTGYLTIPQRVSTIGSRAFFGCSGFTGKLTIPQKVTTIEAEAFQFCSGFTEELTIPQGVTTIGADAFWGCKGFTSLIFEDGVTTVPTAFGGCTGITTITSYSATPPTCTSGCFDSIDKDNCTLKVPSNSIKAYLEAEEWGEFINIIEIELPDAACIAKLYVGKNGTVTTNDTTYNSNTSIEVTEGEDFTFTVTPDENCAIVSVLLDGVDITDQLVDNQYTISDVQESFTLNVSFEKLPTYLTLSVWEQGATWLEMVEGSTLSLRIVPTEGWIINSVSYNGEDVTEELDEKNNFTTPAIANGDALVVTYQKIDVSSVATTASATNIRVYASSANQITIVGAESGDEIAVYTTSGSAVAQRVASSNIEQVDVANGAVYIVQVGNYTFKLAL